MLLTLRPALCLVSAALLVAGTPVPPVARTLAHPVVRGTAGPYARVEVVLFRRGPDAGTFTGVARAGGRRVSLQGKPDEPEGFFYLEPRAVLFMPVDRSKRNGIVILYRSSRIGPGHGTDNRALVYRLERARAVRLPVLEEQLEGVADATTARRRLERALAQ